MWETVGNVLTAGVTLFGVTVEQPPSDAPTNAYDAAVATIVVTGAVAGLYLWLSDEEPEGAPALAAPGVLDAAD